MIAVIGQMTALIVCGLLWRVAQPGGIAADSLRPSITAVVYYLFLPALVLDVLWRAPLGLHSLAISAVAGSGVFLGALLGWWGSRALGHSRATVGAVVLAAGWPNATYLGLPVLERMLGDSGRVIAIQFDLFACTPLLLTLGVGLARHFGSESSGPRVGSVVALLRVPALWAAAVAVVLNLLQVPLPVWLEDWLGLLGRAVIPLMLFALGLALGFGHLSRVRPAALMLVTLIQLVVMPAFAWFVTMQLGLSGALQLGVVLEAAMPSMVLGIVFCDRFGLDSSLYAAVVTWTTILSLATLPLWYALLA